MAIQSNITVYFIIFILHDFCSYFAFFSIFLHLFPFYLHLYSINNSHTYIQIHVFLDVFPFFVLKCVCVLKFNRSKVWVLSYRGYIEDTVSRLGSGQFSGSNCNYIYNGSEGLVIHKNFLLLVYTEPASVFYFLLFSLFFFFCF